MEVRATFEAFAGIHTFACRILVWGPTSLLPAWDTGPKRILSNRIGAPTASSVRGKPDCVRHEQSLSA